MAEICVDRAKLRHNIQTVQRFCRSKGVELVGVVKGCQSCLPLIRCFDDEGIDLLGLSRVEVARACEPFLRRRPYLVTMPGLRRSQEAARYCQTSLISELSAIESLADAADRQGRPHGVVLMVDLGDLREGVLPEQVIPTVRRILERCSPSIRLQGLGANFACCSGLLPDRDNLGLLAELAHEVQDTCGYELQTVSVGGTVALDWMQHHPLPGAINQIRVGEGILLGTLITPQPELGHLYQDVFTLTAEVLEVKEKPSLPVGSLGADAFGRRHRFEDRGLRRRAVLHVGAVDTDTSGIAALSHALEIVNSNSEYSIVDVTDCDPPVHVGERIDFRMTYKALARSFVSPFVSITWQGGP